MTLICGENNEIEYSSAIYHNENQGKMAQKSPKSAPILRLVTASLVLGLQVRHWIALFCS